MWEMGRRARQGRTRSFQAGTDTLVRRIRRTCLTVTPGQQRTSQDRPNPGLGEGQRRKPRQVHHTVCLLSEFTELPQPGACALHRCPKLPVSLQTPIQAPQPQLLLAGRSSQAFGHWPLRAVGALHCQTRWPIL